ncbi:MAG: HEPN domain-containing protein [Flavipsychrobacter sp.]|nr:HEPN domain-containing protein [Flavipsychrobacter sp.]
MVIKMIANLDNLFFEGVHKYTLADFIAVTKNESFKDKHFNNELLLTHIGKYEAEKFFQPKTFAYNIVNHSKDIGKTQQELISEIESFYSYLNLFVFTLWFVKDNSINMTDAHTLTLSPNMYYTVTNLSIFTNARGEFNDVYFTNKEINLAHRIFINLEKVYTPESEIIKQKSKQNKKGAQEIPYDPNLKVSTYYNNLYKTERAINFLISARKVKYLPQKVSLYMPVFETLFSCGIANEVTQRVSERVAKYIGKNAADRYAIFKIVKDAYNLRSRYLHGDEISNRHTSTEYLKELSYKVDELARNIFYKIIMKDSETFLLSNTDLDEYFNKMMLS